MKPTRLVRHVALSLIAGALVGGFVLGLLHPGDPDPNPIGRTVYAGMMAVRTPLHGGFPPHEIPGGVVTLNGWPHMIVCFVVIFGWLILRERKAAKGRDAKA